MSELIIPIMLAVAVIFAGGLGMAIGRSLGWAKGYEQGYEAGKKSAEQARRWIRGED